MYGVEKMKGSLIIDGKEVTPADDDWPYYTGTAGTLCDVYNSKATAKFKKSLSKTKPSQLTMNWATIGIIGIGVIIGFAFLSGWF